MKNRIRTHPWSAALLLGLLLSLVVVGAALAGNIDPVNKWAWGTNAGWINFAPEYDGVTVYPDHLEGYAWGENIGWIRLGTYIGGGTHTYANDAASTYGVNQDGAGNLSGYAWGTNVGWINFDPDGAAGDDRSGHRRISGLRLGRERRLDQLQGHRCGRLRRRRADGCCVA